jgi:3',5'-cyclic AMP phosphodiesterase CpdA
MYMDALFAEAVVSSHNSDILYDLASFLYEDYEKNFVQHQAAPIDAVLLTGDIATTGLTGDLELAFKSIHGPVMPSDPLSWSPDNPTLAGSTGPHRIPLWLLPGNHDRLRAATLQWYAPGGKLFDTIFEPYWGPVDPTTGESPKVREFDDISRPGLTVKVIAADFNLKHPSHRLGRSFHNQYAQGRVYPEILSELVDKTMMATRRIKGPRAILWAIHFPPKFPGIAHAMQLIDERALIDAARHCRVNAILSGHTHEAVRYTSPGTTYDVFCCGTTTQKHAPSGNFFHIINIEKDQHGQIVITPENYIFDSYYREFVSV